MPTDLKIGIDRRYLPHFDLSLDCVGIEAMHMILKRQVENIQCVRSWIL